MIDSCEHTECGICPECALAAATLEPARPFDQYAKKWGLTPDCIYYARLPDGWLEHLDHMFRDLALVQGWDPKFVSTLKSKFGGLRIHYGSIPHNDAAVALRSVVERVVSSYIEEAVQICEECGSRDGTTTSLNPERVVYTYCKIHRTWPLPV